ncbi:MAG TPA: LysR family transcriptional regulator [Nakamurella sp.]|nr:LysR family transcriptional regulator [Nakamurella sp.]
MTPTQLRAFAAVVRLGSVKQAAAELDVSEAAVSLHIGALRRELGDALFTRTGSGLAFTPGGLRLASRATELLGLQDRTILEVSQAGQGRRLLRVAASSLFAEHAAPGLIELFAGRAADLDVEMSLHNPRDFASLLRSRTVDAAIGPGRPSAGAATQDIDIAVQPFLNYQVVAVLGPTHPLARSQPGLAELRRQTWLLGPSAAGPAGLVPQLVRRLGIPEEHQQIFQSQAAALEETKRGRGLSLVVSFAVSADLASGNLLRVPGSVGTAEGSWSIHTLAGSGATPAAAELARFVVTPRAIQAMLRGSGVTVGRFRPSIHVTLWS